MYSLTKRITLLTTLTCASLTVTAGPSGSAGNLSTADAVDAAVVKLGGARGARATPSYRSSSWLAALPSVGLSYLGSEDDDGIDETELSLNLPVKSPQGFKVDRQLAALEERLAGAELERRRLYASGLLREALWSHRMARSRADFSASKVARMEEMLKQAEILFAAQGTSRSSLLLIRRELLDARAELADHDWQVQEWQQRYQQLTGLSAVPVDFAEPPAPAQSSYPEHPLLRIQELQWLQRQQQLVASSGSYSPWTVSLTAKELDGPHASESQYGLALNIPLSALDLSSAPLTADWRAAAREYWQNHDEMMLSLQQSWQQLAGEAHYLAGRQSLLDESAAVSAQLLEDSEALMAENELGREIWLRRLVDDIDHRASAAINRLLVQQNHSMARQAAGIPL